MTDYLKKIKRVLLNQGAGRRTVNSAGNETELPSSNSSCDINFTLLALEKVRVPLPPIYGLNWAL